MNWVRLLFFLVGFLSACSAPLSSLQGESFQQLAAAQERESCDANQGEIDPQFLSPEVVRSVEPLYEILETKHGQAYLLRGALLRVSAQPGMTSEWLQRSLKCYQARRVLSPPMDAADDPYWLPMGWVHIEVNSDGESFLVNLRGEDLERAEQVLKRARAFLTASNPPQA